MDQTQQRLKDSAEACIKAYDVWGNSKKNAEARERLQEAVHELRKVAARLEIEMASSERDELTQRQIAIPPHRASRGRQAEIGNELPDFITEGGSAADESADDGPQPTQNVSAGLRPRTHTGGARRPQGGGQRRPQERSSPQGGNSE